MAACAVRGGRGKSDVLHIMLSPEVHTDDLLCQVRSKYGRGPKCVLNV